jgi:PAS domain S-box-containing protein
MMKNGELEEYFDLVGVIIVIIDRKGKVSLINSKGSEILGYNKEEIVGKSWFENFVLKEDESLEVFNELMDGKKEQSEMAIVTGNGEIKIISWHNQVLVDDKGNITGILLSGDDITPHKKAEMQIKFLTDILDRINDAVIAVNNDYRVIYWNKSAEKLLNQRYDEVKGKLLSEIDQYEWVNFKDEKEPYESLKTHGHWHGKNMHIKKNGKSIWVDSAVNILKYEKNEFNGTLTVIYDITKQKQIEKSLKKVIEDLKRSNEELQQFAYVTSHDLQEPLRTIASFTQLLERRYKGKLDLDADEFIGYIVDATKRMQTLINDLLNYSRVRVTGDNFKLIDTEEIIHQTLSNLKALIKENSAVITHDPLPRVMADPGQLLQLFQNLIGNAIKFRKPEIPPKIHVSARKNEKNNEYVFSVQDNGIGMDPQYAKRIFTIFQRLHTQDEYAGTGIGLAVSKKVVEMHGGRIWVESKPGKGSVFYFTIPIKKP